MVRKKNNRFTQRPSTILRYVLFELPLSKDLTHYVTHVGKSPNFPKFLIFQNFRNFQNFPNFPNFPNSENSKFQEFPKLKTQNSIYLNFRIFRNSNISKFPTIPKFHEIPQISKIPEHPDFRPAGWPARPLKLQVTITIPPINFIFILF